MPLQLTTLRGAILEDAIPSTARHGTARGLPLKEVLEYVIPELSIQCLRQAASSPKVPEQLLKLDEQGVRIVCEAEVRVSLSPCCGVFPSVCLSRCFVFSALKCFSLVFPKHAFL